MNIGNISTENKVVLNLTYINNSNPEQTENISLEFDSGDNLNKFQVLYNLYKNGQQGDIFQEALAKEIYKTLSDDEKKLIDSIKRGETTLVSTGISLDDSSAITDEEYSLAKGVPTSGYLSDLKASEELDFKNRELEKFRKKMQKISGNQPLDELVFDVQGTSIRLSNIHVTNLEKLDRDRIKSPAFE